MVNGDQECGHACAAGLLRRRQDFVGGLSGRLEAIALRVEAIASRLEAIAWIFWPFLGFFVRRVVLLHILARALGPGLAAACTHTWLP